MIDFKVKELDTIADKILLDEYVDPVSALPPDDIEALCYILTKKIKDLLVFDMGHHDALFSFLCRLNRHQVGLFWKVFNFFCKDRSELWYLKNKAVSKKIIDSFVCRDENPMAYWAKVRNLEAVLVQYRVQCPALGMQYDH